MSTTARLVTFPPALDCEATRWLLARLGLAYKECPHSLPGLPIAIRWHGGDETGMPVLFTGDEILVNLRPIFYWVEGQLPPERALVPASPAAAAEVEKAWQDYSNDLGGQGRDFAYYHLLRHPTLMIGPFTRGIPLIEKPLGWSTFPVAALYIWKTLSLSAERAQASIDGVRRIFDGIDAKLADGRRYLVGDSFTLADLLFAVNAAPLVMAPEYGGALPPLERVPPEMQAAVTELRARDAGRFALRMYREEGPGQGLSGR